MMEYFCICVVEILDCVSSAINVMCSGNVGVGRFTLSRIESFVETPSQTSEC